MGTSGIRVTLVGSGSPVALRKSAETPMHVPCQRLNRRGSPAIWPIRPSGPVVRAPQAFQDEIALFHFETNGVSEATGSPARRWATTMQTATSFLTFMSHGYFANATLKATTKHGHDSIG